MQQRSEETRNHILAASLKLFAQSGYDAAGVAEICAAAGVSKGAFYHHFPSKQAVFLVLLHNWLEGLDAQVGLVRQGAQSVPQAFLHMSSMMRIVFQAAGGYLPMFLEFWTQANRDPTVWQATIAPYRRYQELFAGMVQEGIQEGSLRPVDPQVSARLIVALALGILLQGLLDPQGTDWEQVTQLGMHYLMDGLAKEE